MQRKIVNIALITADSIATYKQANEFYSRGAETRKIPLANIAVRANFNKRDDFGNIRELADGILATGGTDPIFVDILKDGTAVITDGERRYRAYLLLNSEGHEGFDTMQALPNGKEMTEADRLFKQYNSNNGKKFEPMEEAYLFRELREAHGMSNAEIARRTGKNTMHVSNMLRLSGIDSAEKDMITAGQVSPTAVLDMVKKGMTSEERINAVKDSAESGEKLKVKDVPLLEGTEPAPLDKNATPETIFKEILQHIKALDRLIGTDSKMSDITFKIDQRVREARTMIKEKYALKVAVSKETNDFISKPDGKITDVYANRDALFHTAVNLCISHQQVSASLLQRKLGIGYARADRILNEMEACKIIGPFMGSQPRELLVKTETQYKHLVTFLDDEQPF